MAWDKTKPTDDGLLINAPGEIRANWEAIEALTTSALQITDAKVSSSAAISDTKLAAITSTSKVSGTSLYSLGSIPSGAGTIPLTNIPSTLTGKDADTLDGQHGSYYRNADNFNAGDLSTTYGGLGSDLSATVQGSILYFSATGVISVLTPGTSGYYLKTQGSGANPTWAEVDVELLETFSAGSEAHYTLATQRSTTSQSPVCIKDIKIPRDGTFTVGYTLSVDPSGGTARCYGQVYLNTVAVAGSPNSTTTSAGFTETITASAADSIQLYIYKSSNATTAYGSAFSISASVPVDYSTVKDANA